MRIFITGATGFVGKAVVKQLLDDGHTLTVLQHKRNMNIEDGKLSLVRGSVLYPEGWTHLLSGVDAVIHLVGIIREYPIRNITFERLHVQAVRNITDAAVKTGVKRYFHMSANGAARGKLKYYDTKIRGEEIVKNSGLVYTIFRPSVIYGAGDVLTQMLGKNMKRFPIFPCFGDGDFMLQPVYVGDVAKVFSKSLQNTETERKTFQIGGTSPISWIDLLKMLNDDVLSVNRKIIHLPLPLVRGVVKVLGKLSFFPMTEEMLMMLLEGNTTADNQIFALLKLSPVNIVETVRAYLV